MIRPTIQVKTVTAVDHEVAAALKGGEDQVKKVVEGRQVSQTALQSVDNRLALLTPPLQQIKH